MTPFPVEPARALGPMRLVVTTYPSRDAARAAIDGVLKRRLAACANAHPVESRYWWRGEIESADEVAVTFKTGPKRVGALMRYLKENHPYDVPEIVELDVPRADPEYLAYLSRTLDGAAANPAPATHARRRGGRPGRAARRPGRTPTTHPPRSR